MFMTPHRNEKMTGLPHLRLTVNKQQLFFTLQNVGEGPHSPAIMPDMKSLQREITANHHHRNEGYGKPSDYTLFRHVDKIANLHTGSQMVARKVSPGRLILPKRRNKPKLGSPAPVYLYSTGKGTTAGERLINTSDSFLKTNINIVNTKATCHPKSHIVFLKTHKTASSTILNILYRYGESRNLTFALPLNKHSQLYYPYLFASHFVEGFSSRRLREFHIMCNHMRFKKSEVSFIMVLILLIHLCAKPFGEYGLALSPLLCNPHPATCTPDHVCSSYCSKFLASELKC